MEHFIVAKGNVFEGRGKKLVALVYLFSILLANVYDDAPKLKKIFGFLHSTPLHSDSRIRLPVHFQGNSYYHKIMMCSANIIELVVKK